jgi:tRNA A-37 threonylcarbamoyl transferase component Bud32
MPVQRSLTDPTAAILPARRSGLCPPVLERSRKLKSAWSALCDDFLPLKHPATPWRYSRRMTSADSRQGWKIHVSATILKACETLEKVGSFLREVGVAFKAPATLDELRKLNSGIWYGYCQVGKFVTVYPRDRDEFVSLCHHLHEMTKNIGFGPAVPFDKKYAPETNVYYRYGSFRDRIGSEASDQIIISPTGERFEDRRGILAAAPSWDTDPFTKTFAVTTPTPLAKLGTRYKVFRSLTQRGKGGVYEAIDMDFSPPRLCIIKEGRENGETAWDRRDGRSRIKNEAAILSALGFHLPFIPKIYEVFEEDGNYYVVLEKLDGISLQKFFDRSPKPLPIDIALHFAKELARIVAEIHSFGFVWRDCKPSNIIVESSGRLRTIDFEGACQIAEFDPIAWSTPDYSPPEISTGFYIEERPSNLPEDLFALGCCLYLLVEGKRPFESYDFLSPRAMERLVGSEITNLISGLLSPDPGERPQARKVLRAFDGLDQRHLF